MGRGLGHMKMWPLYSLTQTRIGDLDLYIVSGGNEGMLQNEYYRRSLLRKI